MLILLLILIIIYSLILLFLPSYDIKLIKEFGLLTSSILFLLSLLLYVKFNANIIGFQQIYVLKYHIFNLNLNYYIGIDGISLFFIILTTFLIPICILISWHSIKYRIKEFIFILFLIEFLVINVFINLDILYFYIFFESVLIPMFILIGIWGSRVEKIYAAIQFFLYTLAGSILMLLAILIIYFHLGSTNYDILLFSSFSKSRQLFLWLAFFLSFAVKTPMLPFHIWLPKAHVEAPTSGSVILAGILLKMGTYGFLRFSINLFPYATKYFTPFIFLLSLIAIIYTSLTTIRQIDLKRIIAYSSVGHMNLVLIGLFSNNIQGIEGSILLMLSHGLVSSALFIMIGFLYDRYSTRILIYYSGLIFIMPIFGIFFFILILANISFPGTSSFVGEFLIFLGIFKLNIFVGVFAGFGMILGAIYSMWLYNRLMFVTLTNNINYYSDLTRKEFFIVFPLCILILIMGLKPNIFLNIFHLAVLYSIY